MRVLRTIAAVAVAASLGSCGDGQPSSGSSHVFTVPANLPARPGATTTDAAPTAPASTTSAAPTGTSAVPAAPPIVERLIPFDAKRRAEMVAYAQRHYGMSDYHLRDPRVIVEHYTESTTFESAYNTFVQDVPDPELHELPGTCAHFIVDRDGTIYQLVPLSIMCRHTVGLNWTAIGIEHVGMSDQDVLGNRPQLDASLALTTWLRCRFHIAIRNVIGHNESLTSPYHRENVPALRTQTHADMQKPAMDSYRADLQQRHCSG